VYGAIQQRAQSRRRDRLRATVRRCLPADAVSPVVERSTPAHCLAHAEAVAYRAVQTDSQTWLTACHLVGTVGLERTRVGQSGTIVEMALTRSGNFANRLAAILVAASSVAHAPATAKHTDQRRNRARFLVGRGAVARAPALQPSPAVPLKQEPLARRFRGRSTPDQRQPRADIRSVDHRYRTVAQPQPRPRRVS